MVFPEPRYFVYLRCRGELSSVLISGRVKTSRLFSAEERLAFKPVLALLPLLCRSGFLSQAMHLYKNISRNVPFPRAQVARTKGGVVVQRLDGEPRTELPYFA